MVHRVYLYACEQLTQAVAMQVPQSVKVSTVMLVNAVLIKGHKSCHNLSTWTHTHTIMKVFINIDFSYQKVVQCVYLLLCVCVQYLAETPEFAASD